jgi:hypothetical protein
MVTIALINEILVARNELASTLTSCAVPRSVTTSGVSLRAHRATQEAEGLVWGEAWVDSGRVFTKEDGSTLNADSVSQRFDRLVARHHLPSERLHDLRHGAATLALAAGANNKVVSHELGHSSTQITQDLHTSVLPQVSQAAAEAVASLPQDVDVVLACRRQAGLSLGERLAHLGSSEPYRHPKKTDRAIDAARYPLHVLHGVLEDLEPPQPGREPPSSHPTARSRSRSRRSRNRQACLRVPVAQPREPSSG